MKTAIFVLSPSLTYIFSNWASSSFSVLNELICISLIAFLLILPNSLVSNSPLIFANKGSSMLLNVYITFLVFSIFCKKLNKLVCSPFL